MSIDTTFLTLRVFSATGGIEKVCRILGKALYEKSLDGGHAIQIISSHDGKMQAYGNGYFPSEIFEGCGNSRLKFVLSAVKKGIRSKKVILSHVNLLPVGWLIKKINPAVELYLLAHGIEVWSIPLGYKASMLKKCDRILCVSEFTSNEMAARYDLPPEKLAVVNNCLDPFLPAHDNSIDVLHWRKKYGLSGDDRVIFTLTRMDPAERYKGYDRVIEALSAVQQQCPHLKYLIGGSYAAAEKLYIDKKIADYGLIGKVIFTGFIAEEDLAFHFLMSDYYVMPSYNEGFGIVFIEALYYGLPVVAGNKDGSVDALDKGNLGKLIDPMDISAIQEALVGLYKNGNQQQVASRKEILAKFGYESYKIKLERLLYQTS